MHHLTRGISSLLHSVNLILFTLLVVHLILRISPHHSLELYQVLKRQVQVLYEYKYKYMGFDASTSHLCNYNQVY